ncbi:MAG: biotin--[acetyl-CoA-carboxylase] ligase [Anaerolineaceae bacterium]|nr:MAG: biotin--[acetyl-CoA-carboxylase] ligase [Anaerolineaceae bacterium]
MKQTSLQKSLASLSLGGLRYFDSIGSTNDEALAWATEGARDFSLIIADEQTTGRGRAGRKWVTPQGTALAFSLILRPNLTPASSPESSNPSLFTGLGAVALVDALKKHGLKPQIKWPNDILLNRKKVAGILVESVWTGDALDTVVLGMGVNALAGSNPPDDGLLFPATNVENELGRPPQRVELLRDILSSLMGWRPKMSTGELTKTWEENLSFRGEQVEVWKGDEKPLAGRVMGLESDGSLRLLDNDKIVTVQFGEIHLRPAV